jgi:hypothetical protein
MSRSLTTYKYAHLTEELFATFLTRQNIEFEYEPREFILLTDLSGNIRQSFLPDFYLPEYDLYLEITALKQSLVKKKKAKLKLARLIYPQVKFEILYKNDLIEILINQNSQFFYDKLASLK